MIAKYIYIQFLGKYRTHIIPIVTTFYARATGHKKVIKHRYQWAHIWPSLRGTRVEISG